MNHKHFLGFNAVASTISHSRVTQKMRCSSCPNPIQNRDRINQLPDTIQTHILSFLSIEDATKARLLSKQWRNLRPPLFNLSFSELKLSANNRSMSDYIKQVFLYVGSSDVQSFVLTLRLLTNITKAYLHKWVAFAVKHRVRSIVLDGKMPCIPVCITGSPTLSDLKLLKVDLVDIAVLPFFPVLKTLSMHGCTLSQKQLNHICTQCVSPLLEDFTLRSCMVDYKEGYSVILSAPHIKFLCVDSCDGEIDIRCPNLQQLDVNGSIIIDLDTLANVLVARFGNGDYGPRDTLLMYGATYILKGLRNVVKLYLANQFMEALISDLDSSACQPELCCSLKYLEIDFRPGNQQALNLLDHLLGSYPNLTSLSVNLKGIITQVPIESATTYDSSAVDGLKKLKIVEINDFTGSENDLCFVRYVLGKADSMEKLNIVYSRQVYVEAENQMKILKKLLGFTRASPRAAVLIS